MWLKPTNGRFGFKVGSETCDPDCPFCCCVVYPKNSVGKSCELEVSFVWRDHIRKRLTTKNVQ